LQSEGRKKQEICRAIYGELEQLLPVIYQNKANPIELKTPVYDKFEVEFWHLPEELTQSIRRVYTKFAEANRLLNATETVQTMIRGDLWYNYLPNDIIKLQEQLKTYEATLTKENVNRGTVSLANPPEANNSQEWDCFICHASEDKTEIAEPLAKMLQEHDLKVWYDTFTLSVGDSLRRKIDKGLANSRYGIVILSPSFFTKNWPQKELDGLAAREGAEGQKVILPVWHHVDRDHVLKFSPTLADRLAARTGEGLENVLSKLLQVLVKPNRDVMGRQRVRAGADTILSETSSQEQNFLKRLIEQFSDIQLLLHDFRDHLINPDMNELLYSLGASGRILLNMSSETTSKKLGVEAQLIELSEILEQLESHRFYIGSKSVDEFGEKAQSCNAVLSVVFDQVRKHVQGGSLRVYKELVGRNIDLLRKQWDRRQRYFESASIQRLREAFRRYGFLFYRFGNYPEAEDFADGGQSLRTLGEKLRNLSSIQKYFSYGLGTNPLVVIEPRFSECAQLMDQIVSEIGR